ncbi:MAG: hypothetical protein R6V05_09455, partial [Candidatus Brocadiia bacterium]
YSKELDMDLKEAQLDNLGLAKKGTRRRSIVGTGAIPRESPHEGPFADEAQLVDLIAHYGQGGGGFSSGKKADLGATSRRLEELGYV